MLFRSQAFLEKFLELSPKPQPRMLQDGTMIMPENENFSAFVFKIQANMNPAHRDRISFIVNTPETEQRFFFAKEFGIQKKAAQIKEWQRWFSVRFSCSSSVPASLSVSPFYVLSSLPALWKPVRPEKCGSQSTPDVLGVFFLFPLVLP